MRTPVLGLLVLLAAAPALAQSSSPLASDMKALLDAQAALGAKPIETLTPEDARRQPTLADAATRLARGAPAPPDGLEVKDVAYASDPTQVARIYTPEGARRGPKLPVVIYIPGGGGVTGGLAEADPAARALSRNLHALVISVGYRLAPEHPFPAQLSDVNYAYDWAHDHMPEWHGNRGRMLLAGEGFGATLAVDEAVRDRDAGKRTAAAVLVIDPQATGDRPTLSKALYAQARPLSASALAWQARQTGAMADDPHWDLTRADLHGLPPMVIVNAEVDPLRDDGAALETAVRAARGRVERQVFPGVAHGFFGFGQLVRGAYDAQVYVTDRVRLPLRNLRAGDPGSFQRAPTR